MTIESIPNSFEMIESDQEIPADYYSQMVDRNLGVLTPEQQATVRKMIVAIAGVGGNADVAITLAQMGFQHFRVADPDVYGMSNLNRQLGCTSETLGKSKAVIIAEEIKRINPTATVEIYPDGVTVGNVESFLRDADVVVDGIDIYAMDAKKKYFDVARKNGQAVFCCPAIGYGDAIGIFDPEKSPTFAEYFGAPPANQDPADLEFRRYVENFGMMFLSTKPAGMDMTYARKRSKLGKAPAIAAGCRLNSALVASAVMDYKFGLSKNIPIVPTTWHIDLVKGKIIKTGKIKRWLLKKVIAMTQMKGDI